jgi:formiminotetrahydrofolate cyclodeaminase
MSDSVWNETLEEFRKRLAGRDPAPAGVTAATVSATLALGLLIKVLEITRNRKNFSGDAQRMETLIHDAAEESTRLAQYADDDIEAYKEYLASRRSAAALRRAIEVPLAAARAAASGLELCAQSADLVPAALAPDLDAARTLLAGALRATFFSIEANLRQELDQQYRENVEAEVVRFRSVVSSE